MSIYSIKDLEKLSGIKAHTIRIWEQRYKLIKPNRTHLNIRYYDESELKRLLDIALLNKNGYKISKIATFCEHCINHILSSLTVDENNTTRFDELTLVMVTMNEEKFHRVVDAKIKESGFTRTLADLILPFLEKLNFLRLAGTINTAHENFIINLIRHKTIVVTDKIHKKKQAIPKFLLYLPEGEKNDLLLLLMQYLLRSGGFRTFFLGKDMNLEDVTLAYQTIKPDFVFTILSENFTGKPIGIYIDELLKLCPQAKLLLSGYQTNFLQESSRSRIRLLNSLDDAIHFIEEIKKINIQ